MMLIFQYDGPVVAFGTVIAPRWSGKTMAVSEKKALSNLMYQYKKANGLAPSSKISLPGKLVEIEPGGSYGRY